MSVADEGGIEAMRVTVTQSISIVEKEDRTGTLRTLILFDWESKGETAGLEAVEGDRRKGEQL